MDTPHAVFGREGGDCPIGAVLPAGLWFTPAELEVECFDVAVGDADNVDFRWLARAGEYDDMGIYACFQDCNGAMSCLDHCNEGVPGGATPPECAGTYFLVQPASPVPCDAYGPVGIDIQGRNAGAEGQESSAAEGAGGSGEFMLFPTSLGDYDGNGQFHARLIPIQLGGTGRLTASARLTAITSVTIPTGASLRLLKDKTPSFKWQHDDLLFDPASNSIPITGPVTFPVPKPIAPGVFVASGIAATDLEDFRVSMSWTVGSNEGAVHPQGWSFRLRDIGCSTYVQAITVRRLTSPDRISIEPYGVPWEKMTFPAAPGTQGVSFDFTTGGLHVVGELQNMSSQGATLVLSTLTYRGVNICSTGTLALEPE